MGGNNSAIASFYISVPNKFRSSAPLVLVLQQLLEDCVQMGRQQAPQRHSGPGNTAVIISTALTILTYILCA